MLALLIASVLTQPSADGCWGGSGERTFRTCFDPGRGLELQAGAAAQGLSAGMEAGLSLRLRGERDSSSKAGTHWLLAHQVAQASGRWSTAERQWRLTAYEGLARRHVDEGSVLLPTTPPIRLPFPFDLGLYARLASYERRIEEGPGWSLETARLAILFDPVRSTSGRVHLALGPALSHRLLHDGRELSHQLTPLTALQVVASVESENGLWVLRARANAGWTFDPAAFRSGATFRARGELNVERVLLAVNDQPVALQLRALGAWADAGATQKSEWGAGAALKMQLFAHR